MVKDFRFRRRRSRFLSTWPKWRKKVSPGLLLLRDHSLIGRPRLKLLPLDSRRTDVLRGIANGFFGFDIKAKRAKIYGSGDERWTGTTLTTIGLAVARLLRKPHQVQNRFIYVYSVASSQNEILASLEAATGTKWDTHHVKWEDEIPAGRKKLEQGDRSGGVPLVLSYFYRPGMGADYTMDVEAANALLELPAETITEIVRKALALT
jgi:hypothetical protein